MRSPAYLSGTPRYCDQHPALAGPRKKPFRTSEEILCRAIISPPNSPADLLAKSKDVPIETPPDRHIVWLGTRPHQRHKPKRNTYLRSGAVCYTSLGIGSK